MSILPVIQDSNLYYLKLEARVLTYLCLFGYYNWINFKWIF